MVEEVTPQIAAHYPWSPVGADAGGEQAIPRHDPHIGAPHRVNTETLEDQSHARADDENIYAGADPIHVFIALADRVERIRESLEELANRESVGNVFTIPAAGNADAAGNLSLAYPPISYGWSWAVDRIAVTAAPNAVIAIYDSIVSPMAFRGRFSVDANGFGVDVYPAPLVFTPGEILLLRCTGLGALGTPVTAITQVRQFTR